MGPRGSGSAAISAAKRAGMASAAAAVVWVMDWRRCGNEINQSPTEIRSDATELTTNAVATAAALTNLPSPPLPSKRKETQDSTEGDEKNGRRPPKRRGQLCGASFRCFDQIV